MKHNCSYYLLSSRHAAFLLLMGAMLCSQLAQAQSESGLAAVPRPSLRNVVRLDLLTPLGLNLGYNLFADRQLLFPVILSYERAMTARWSVNTEIALNGGEPDARRYGGNLSARYYMRPTKKMPSSLSGFYLAPVVGYLALRLIDEPPLMVINAKRIKSGVLIGWQYRLSQGMPRIMFDFAAGATYWSVLGNDQVSNLGNNGVSFGVLKPGMRPEARGGLGYQF